MAMSLPTKRTVNSIGQVTPCSVKSPVTGQAPAVSSYRLETTSDPAHDEVLGAETDKGMRWIDLKCACWRDKRVIDDTAVVSIGSFAHMPLPTPGPR